MSDHLYNATTGHDLCATGPKLTCQWATTNIKNVVPMSEIYGRLISDQIHCHAFMSLPLIADHHSNGEFTFFLFFRWPTTNVKKLFPRLRYVVGLQWSDSLSCFYVLTASDRRQNKFEFHLFQNLLANERPLNKCEENWSDSLLCFYVCTVIADRHTHHPANMRHSPNVVSMLAHRMRRWPNIAWMSRVYQEAVAGLGFLHFFHFYLILKINALQNLYNCTA